MNISYFMFFSVVHLTWKRLLDLPYQPGCYVKAKITFTSLFLWVGTDDLGASRIRGLAFLQKADTSSIYL